MAKPSLFPSFGKLRNFDPAILDQLEGLNERHAKLSARIEGLEARIDAGTAYDLPPDTEQLGTLVDARRRAENEAIALLETLLGELRSEGDERDT